MNSRDIDSTMMIRDGDAGWACDVRNSRQISPLFFRMLQRRNKDILNNNGLL